MVNNIAIPLLIVVSGFVYLEFFIPIAIGEFIHKKVGLLANRIACYIIESSLAQWKRLYSCVRIRPIRKLVK